MQTCSLSSRANLFTHSTHKLNSFLLALHTQLIPKGIFLLMYLTLQFSSTTEEHIRERETSQLAWADPPKEQGFLQ